MQLSFCSSLGVALCSSLRWFANRQNFRYRFKRKSWPSEASETPCSLVGAPFFVQFERLRMLFWVWLSNTVTPPTLSTAFEAGSAFVTCDIFSRAVSCMASDLSCDAHPEVKLLASPDHWPGSVLSFQSLICCLPIFLLQIWPESTQCVSYPNPWTFWSHFSGVEGETYWERRWTLVCAEFKVLSTRVEYIVSRDRWRGLMANARAVPQWAVMIDWLVDTYFGPRGWSDRAALKVMLVSSLSSLLWEPSAVKNSTFQTVAPPTFAVTIDNARCLVGEMLWIDIRGPYSLSPRVIV